MTNLVHLTNETVTDFIDTHPEPFLLAFKAAWCSPCRFLTPILEAIASEGIVVAVMDVDESHETAQDQGITSLPTTICFKRCTETSRVVGLTTKARLQALL